MTAFGKFPTCDEITQDDVNHDSIHGLIKSHHVLTNKVEQLSGNQDKLISIISKLQDRLNKIEGKERESFPDINMLHILKIKGVE